MEKMNGLLALLGEENEQKIKNRIADLIVECVGDDLTDYDRENYMLNPEEIIEFIEECKGIAFDRMREEVIKNMTDKIRLSLGEQP